MSKNEIICTLVVIGMGLYAIFTMWILLGGADDIVERIENWWTMRIKKK